MGAEWSQGPLFHVKDGRARIVARSVDGGLPLLAVRRWGRTRQVFIGFAPASSTLLRNLCELAGVHLYAEAGDVVYANESYLAVHSAAPGRRTIYLPSRCRITDAFSGELVVKDDWKLTYEANGPMTRLFLVEATRK